MLAGLKQILVPILIVISGFLCLEFSFPISVGEFLAVMLGHTFFDLNNIPWLKFFSYLGLLGIMFLAGFEIDTKVIKKELHKSLVLGFTSFFIPYLAVLFFSMLFNIGIQQVLILATALSTTSLAMVFTILKQSDRINTPQGQIILGSAMVVDLLSMISLSLIIFKFTLYNLVFLAALVGILIFLRKIVFSIFSRYKGNRFEMELKFFLLLLLSLGILAEAAGLHSAAMAFLIGIMFSNIEYEHRMIIDKLNTIVFSLLAPIFFFHAGSMVSVTEMKFLTVVMFIVFLLVAVFGKFFGTYFALYFLYNKDKEFARYGGVLFNYRLSFGIVTGMYAYELELIDIQILNVILLIVALSSIIAVILEKKAHIFFKGSTKKSISFSEPKPKVGEV